MGSGAYDTTGVPKPKHKSTVKFFPPSSLYLYKALSSRRKYHVAHSLSMILSEDILKMNRY